METSTQIILNVMFIFFLFTSIPVYHVATFRAILNLYVFSTDINLLLNILLSPLKNGNFTDACTDTWQALFLENFSY